MTDRINALSVVLNKDIRDDDIQPTIDAIMQLKGVLGVAMNVSDITDHIAYARARSELTTKLYEALRA